MLKKILLTLLVATNFDLLSKVNAAEKESEEMGCKGVASKFIELPRKIKLHIFSYLQPSFTLGKKTEFDSSITTKSDLIHCLYGYVKGDKDRKPYLLFPQIKIEVKDSYKNLFKRPNENNNELVTFGTILSLKGLNALDIENEYISSDASYFIHTLTTNILVASTVQKISYDCTNGITTENIQILSSIPTLTHLKLFRGSSLGDTLEGYNQDSPIQYLDISYVKRLEIKGPQGREKINEFTRETFEHLAGAKNLTHLNVTRCKLGKYELEPLLKSASLQYIILSNKGKTERTGYESKLDNKINQKMLDQFKNKSITIIDPQGDLVREQKKEDEELLNSFSRVQF